MSAGSGYFPAAVAALIALVIFLPAVKNDFVGWDDPVYVTSNRHITRIDTDFFRWAFFDLADMPLWIPVTSFSFAVDYALWGLDPKGFHLTNVIIHALNVFLVFLVVLGILKAYYRWERAETLGKEIVSVRTMEFCAFLTALFFGLHPLRVESVAWVTERKDMLSGFFGLSAVLFYLKYAGARTVAISANASYMRDKRYISALVLFILSLMSKPMTVTLPFVFLIIDWHPLGRLKKGNLIETVYEKTPFFLAALLSGILTMITQRPGMLRFDDIPLWPRLLQAFKSLVMYLLMMIRPVGLAAFYDHPGRTATVMNWEFSLPIILVIVITAICIRLAKSNRLYLAVWIYYIITLLPVIGIFQAGAHAMGDRFTYLPSIGPALFASIATTVAYRKASDQTGTRRKVVLSLMVAVIVLIIGYFATVSSRQITVWRDTEALWTHAINERPKDAARAYLQRSVEYSRVGRYQGSLDDINASLEIQKRMKYCRIDKSYDLRGSVLLKLGKYKEAADDFGFAISLNPHDPDPEYFEHRAKAYELLGMEDIAEKDRQTALKTRGKATS